MLTKAPKGTKDILPQDSGKWQYIESVMRAVCAQYAYREVRTPVFEHTELFARGVGSTTDIVQKEMYTFVDKGDRSITLRPEGTAGVVRSYIENGLAGAAQPTKVYYLSSPMFRYERPQAGRLREFHQFGIEAFGSFSPSVDAEAIALALRIFEALGISGLLLNINSIGCPVCKPGYNEKLSDYLDAHRDRLCKDCWQRMGTNPLRVLDCKQESCSRVVAEAPKMIDHLCGECADHFDGLKRRLDAAGIEYTIDPLIVRGLDYYTKTVFEIISPDIGAQSAVCGGGRYDGLVEELGGSPTPGIGFGLGMERLLLVLEALGIAMPQPGLCDVYVCTLGEAAAQKGFAVTDALRAGGIRAECDHMGRSMKAQMKYAGKIGAGHVVIIGEDEMEKGAAVVRDMAASEEETVPFAELNQYLKDGRK